MNENLGLEATVARHIAEEGVAPPSDAFYEELLTRADQLGQRPRWLALIKEQPMRTHSRLAVGSPAWRVAVILAATILLGAMIGGASFAGTQLLASDGAIIVDASGDGTHTSITDAVAEAEDGDEVLVRPGTYEESVDIVRDITLRGDGPVDEIILTPPVVPKRLSVDPTAADPYVIGLFDSNAHVSGLTLRGEFAELIADGGSPTIEHLVFDAVGVPWEGTGPLSGSSIVLVDGSTATVRDNDIRNGGPISVFADAAPVVSGNTLADGPHIRLVRHGAGTRVEDNVISGSRLIGISVWGDAPATITGNTLRDSIDTAMWLGGSTTASGNVIEGGPRTSFGVAVEDALSVQLINNDITGTDFAIAWKSGEGRIKANGVEGNSSGIVISGGSPVLEHNRSCTNEAANFAVMDPATPEIRNNDFCEEPAAAS